MAYISRDSTADSGNNSTIPPSFITATDDDPYLNNAASVIYPEVRRNLISDINNAESTVLPAPSEKEALKVYLRVKPRTEDEIELSKSEGYEQNEIVKIETDQQIALIAPKESKAYKTSINGNGKMVHRHTFTHIFKPETDQKEMFSNVVYPCLKDFLEGQNQLLFTYGATSAGKTYTIQGTADEPGLMPMSLDTLFSSIKDKMSATVPIRPVGYSRVVRASQEEIAKFAKEKESVFKLGLELARHRKSPVNLPSAPSSANQSMISQASTASTATSASGFSMDSLDISDLHGLFPSLTNRNRNTSKLEVGNSELTYMVWVSFAEIYNENAFDLLEKLPESKKKGVKVRRNVLKLSDDRDGSTYIKGLKEIQVANADEAYQALMIGRENLQFAATKLNHQSSRSHCIFTVKLIRVANPEDPHNAWVSILSFCDLAGSERISKTNNRGTRQREAGNINTSLLVLGRCIKAIRYNQTTLEPKKQQIVPFRESKLTRLIKTYFTGFGKASLVVCMSQAPYLYDESVHVMKFASIASKVTVEQFKEAVVPVPAPRRKTRFSSIIAGGKKSFANSILSGRGSIAWEPSSRSTMIPDLTSGGVNPFLAAPNFNPAHRSTILPPRNQDITEIDELDESEEAERTVVESADYHALINIVELLKQKLIESRAETKKIEMETRNELCTQFEGQLIEIETFNKERLQEERERVEKRHEWRIEELQKAYNNKKRRRDSSVEDDEGFDTKEMRIISLETKVEERDKELETLKEQLQEAEQIQAAMKDAMQGSRETADKLQEKNSDLQFNLADQQKLSGELGRELVSVKARLEEDQKLHAENMESEETQLNQLKSQVTKLMNEAAKKDEDNADMKDLLQEAGEEFFAKQEEVEKLKSVIFQLETQATQQSLKLDDVGSQLEESHVLLRELNNQLEDRDRGMEELEGVLEEQKKAMEEQEEEKHSLQGKLKIEKENAKTAHQFLDDVKQELERTKLDLEKSQDTDSKKKIEALQEEKQDLLAARAKLMEDLAELKSDKLSNSQRMEVNIYLDELKSDLKNEEELNQKLNSDISTLKGENTRLRVELETYKLDQTTRVRNVDDSMFEDQDDEIFKLRMEITGLTDENLRLKQETEKKKKGRIDSSEKSILETNDFELTEKLITKEQETEEMRKQIVALKEQQQTQKSQNEQLSQQIEEEKKQKEERLKTESTLKEERDRMEKEFGNLNDKLQLLTDEKARTTKELEALKADSACKVQALENAENQLSQLKAASDGQSALSSTANKQLTTDNKQLTTDMEQLTMDKSDLSRALEALTAEKSELETQLCALKQNISSLVESNEEKEKEKMEVQRELEQDLTAIKAEQAHSKTETENLIAAAKKEQSELTSSLEDVKAELQEAVAAKQQLQLAAEQQKEEAEKMTKELEDRIGVMTDKLNETLGSEKIIELEGRTGSLEKELVTKDTYIRELEDIVVEKEFRISELESTTDTQLETKIKEIDQDKATLITDLKLELEAARKSNETLRLQMEDSQAQESKALVRSEVKVRELEKRLADQEEEKEWRAKMKKEREALQAKVEAFQERVEVVGEREDDIKRLQDERSVREKEAAEAVTKAQTLKTALREAQDEVRVLKRATKNSALESQQLAEETVKVKQLEKDLERAQSLLDARTREDGALDLLRDEIRSKGEEIRTLTMKVEYLRTSEEAKDYEISKTKEEREKLMAHYESMLKKKQQEVDGHKNRSNESVKLQEVMARATPTKNKNEVKELTSRLHRAEEDNADLRGELDKLHKLQEELKATHSRELKRVRKASDLVIQEYKDTNSTLQKSGVSVTVTDTSSNNTTNNQSGLEADDSKSESSFIEVTPVVKRSGRSRTGRGGRSNRSNATRGSEASQASFEDSNTENEPEEGGSSRNTIIKVGRRPRVNKARRNVSFQEAHEVEKSSSRKRALKEKQLSTVQELKKPDFAAPHSDSDFLTPGTTNKKKRRLYSATPQHSEVFTPPTDSEQYDSPLTVVTRQLRSRRSKK